LLAQAAILAPPGASTTRPGTLAAVKNYYVYIPFNHTRMLYIGVTSDLLRRLSEHRLKVVPGFTSRYGIDMLAYYEVFPDPTSAIRREKQLKGWTRARKVELVQSVNPGWEDLSLTLYERPATKG
jgi:putative endonuclease